MTEIEQEQLAVAAYIQLKTLTQNAARREVRELLADPRYADPKRLERHGFKVFSQNDEDGIIQEIFRRIGTTNRMFFEFGAGNGLESNCCYLLLQGWHGAWVDGNDEYLAHARNLFSEKIARGQLAVKKEMVYASNIDELATGLDLPQELDLLSIDVDGNDFYIWEALTVLRPRVVIVEYNAAFPPPVRLVQTHQPNLTWGGTSYFGASLSALENLATRKGYLLVGTNLPGVNAFFVRNDLVGNGFNREGAPNLYNPPRFQLGESGFPTGHPPGIGPLVAK